jgi:cytochrome c-type biogenesis protein CcmH/NrfG
MLGNATLELGNIDEANRYYKRAAELAPDPFNFAQCGQPGFEC